MQMRLLFEPKHINQSIAQADYQAICWLINRNYMSKEQAAVLIEELALEVLESFLTLKEGSYEFSRETALDDLPKFCRLDLRALVEQCQRQLRSRYRYSAPDVVTHIEERKEAPQQESEQVDSSVNTVIDDTSDAVANNPSGSNQFSPKQLRKKVYTVACIDDSPTVLSSIKRFLDESTFTVVMINDPVKALMQILRSKPDLILLDVEMPNLDGYELCSLLRRHSSFKDIPIVMVTGRTGFIDRAKAKMVRSSGYLTKPFTQSELLKMVFKHIS
jgi:twitching motility two-component system response regulator PilG